MALSAASSSRSLGSGSWVVESELDGRLGRQGASPRVANGTDQVGRIHRVEPSGSKHLLDLSLRRAVGEALADFLAQLVTIERNLG